MSDDDASMSSATAGLLLGCCAVIGALFLVGLWYMNRSEDPLYRRDPRFFDYVPHAGAGNAPEMQTGINLWKDKNTGVAPMADPTPTARPATPKALTPPPQAQKAPESVKPPTTNPE